LLLFFCKGGAVLKGCVLRFEGISKVFPGVRALDNVSFCAYPGEVLGLMGENGAGKSTLLKILNGDYIPDEGSIFFDDAKQNISSPQEALAKGISILYQERNVIPYLSVAENVFAGKLPQKGIFTNWKELYKRTQNLIEEFEVDFKPTSIVGKLSPAQQQMVEIMKEYNRNIRIMAFDEPTASLSDKEIRVLFKIINKLKQEGVTVIYVSHRMKEVFEITDRIVVLKDGGFVGEVLTKDTDENQLVKMMVGRDIKKIDRDETIEKGEVVLKVRNLTNNRINNVSFELRKSEILGFAGLVGAGRTECAKAIFGSDKILQGEVFLNGKEISIKNTKDAINNGIVYCPEDRKNEALVMARSVKENISVAILKKICKFSFINFKEEKELANTYVDKLQIKTPGLDQKVLNLSGGNQQKVVLSRWLATNPKVLILDEPTRGIDVGAKSEIYSLIQDLAKEGISIIFISSELPELIGNCDRIAVMKNGEIAGTLERDEFSEERILQLAMLNN